MKKIKLTIFILSLLLITGASICIIIFNNNKNKQELNAIENKYKVKNKDDDLQIENKEVINDKPKSEESLKSKKNTSQSQQKISCSNGYTLQNGKCIKIVENTIEPTKNYYCVEQSGYDANWLDGTKCIYSKSYEPYTRYYCENGTLNGNICNVSRILNVPASSVNCSNKDGTISCTRLDDCRCIYTETTPEYAKTEKYCINNLFLDDGKCWFFSELQALYKLTCPPNYTLNAGKCHKN